MRILNLLLLISSLLVSMLPVQASSINDSLDQQVEALWAALSSEERVGQLMMVTFEGSYLGPETAIARLITEYNIGGIVLLAENDNINGQVNTPRLVLSLTNDLQQLAFDAAQSTGDQPVSRTFVPLFIATTHAGNMQPGTQIATGTTPLPSSMALGATWNPEYARQVGQIAGRELSAMGINMLLGPALDVFQRPPAERSLDLGVDSFGGQPAWVGKMGQAYITGVHEGGENRIAVIAQHFPGLGLADTQPDSEIPVVPRSVDELRQIDLVPYNAVTGGAGDTLARADGLQCANIRYQGKNTRSVTGPLCLDEQAASQLLDLDYFRSWRQNHVILSSPLGTQAIRRYYNASPFPHRQIARAAFLAGNDLLYLANMGSSPGSEQLENVIDIINFFAASYDSDPVFRAEVDRALKRILRLKLSLYDGDISFNNVQAKPVEIDTVGLSIAPLYEIAQASATLIAPRLGSLPPPPNRNENLIIFTDVRLVHQCSYCPTYPLVSVNALEVAIERMYGPYAGAQIRPEQVTSFSFSQLRTYLLGGLEEQQSEDSQFKTNKRIGEALRTVDWIVFVLQDVSPDMPSSMALRDFLESEITTLQRSRIVVISLGAPTYLSSTELSKLTAYYALYSNIPPYIDAAARALFQESTLVGAPPINLPAIGYDLFEATSPNPDQTLQLRADALYDRTGTFKTIRAADVLTIQVGDRLIVRTDPILDHNGHPIPDNTTVEFTLTFVTDNLQTRQRSATEDGTARTSFTPGRPGRIQITAASGDASRSATFQVVVTDDAIGQTGPSSEDSTLSATAASSTTGQDSSTETPQPAAQPVTGTSSAEASGGGASEPAQHLDITDFVLSLFALGLMSGLGFAVGLSTTMTIDGGVRITLGSIVAGLIGYIYFGLGGPGITEIGRLLENAAPIATTLGTGLVGMVYTWWTLRYSR